MALPGFRAGFLILSALIVSTLALAAGAAAQGQSKPLSAEDHTKRGDELRSKEDWDGAIAEYREALRLKPNNDSAHADLGGALLGKGDFDGAIAEYREALRLNAKNDNAHRALGGVLGLKGDWNGEI